MNDYRNNTGNDTFCGAYRSIVNRLRLLNPKARIILITPMQRVDFVYLFNMKNNAWGSYRDKNGQWLEQFALAVDSIGSHEKLKVIDLYHDRRLGLKRLVRFKKLKDTGTGTYKNFRYPDFINIPFNPETDEYPYPPESVDMTFDGLHPSDKGYEIIADKLISELKGKK